jgi:hypothetical protein
MSTIYLVGQLQPNPQSFTISLNGVSYNITLNYRNTTNGGWVMDIADSQGNPILQGIPLITGAGLLDQYAYLSLGGNFYVQTTSDPDEVPTFDNLGSDGNLYWVTNP